MSTIEEVTAKLSELESQLKQLGPVRPTATEKRRYLLNISEAYQTIVRSSLSGDYHDPFFAAQGPSFAKRLRSVIQNHNIKFYKLMTVHGQKRLVVDPDETETNQMTLPFMTVMLVSKEEFFEHVRKVIRKTRGLELQVPGTCNLSAVVSQLFREQSEAWNNLAHAQVHSTWKAACKFLSLVVDHLTGQDSATTKAIKTHIFDPALTAILDNMVKKYTQLMEGTYTTHPITYSPEFTRRMEERRLQRLGGSADPETVVRDIFRIAPGVNISDAQEIRSGTYDLKSLVDAMKVLTEQDREQTTVMEAFDAMNIYYDIAVKRFIDNMAIQVVEESLLAKLPDLLSPLAVDSFEAAKLEELVGEDKVKEYREKLLKEIQEKQAELESLQPEEGPVSNPVDDDDGDNSELVDAFLDEHVNAVVGAWALASKAVPGTGALPKGQSGGGEEKKEETPVPVLEPKAEQQQKMESARENKLAGGSGTGKAGGEGGGQEAMASSPITPGGKKGKKKGKN